MASNAAKILGERVHEARVQAGHSLRGFASRTGIDKDAMSRIERGDHNITLSTLLKLAHYLNVPASVLLDGISEVPDER